MGGLEGVGGGPRSGRSVLINGKFRLTDVDVVAQRLPPASSTPPCADVFLLLRALEPQTVVELMRPQTLHLRRPSCDHTFVVHAWILGFTRLFFCFFLLFSPPHRKQPRTCLSRKSTLPSFLMCKMLLLHVPSVKTGTFFFHIH